MRLLIDIDGDVAEPDIEEMLDTLNNLMGRRDGIDDHLITWEMCI